MFNTPSSLSLIRRPCTTLIKYTPVTGHANCMGNTYCSLAGQKTLRSDRPLRKLATCCKGCCKRGSTRTGTYFKSGAAAPEICVLAAVVSARAVPKTWFGVPVCTVFLVVGERLLFCPYQIERWSSLHHQLTIFQFLHAFCCSP